MWNFVKGVKPPQKWKQTSDERRAHEHDYDQKCHKRAFKDDWKNGRPWLRLEKKDDTEVMFCDFCISAGVSTDKTAFISGCSNLRLETIKYHESSNTHLLATNKHANVENPQDAPAYKAKLSLNKAVYAKLSIMFRNVHAINIRARPARDYIWMNQLDECKGLDIGKTYSSNVHKCYEFASAIAEVERNAIKEKLDICKFASVIVNGSMDSSITDNETVYIQSCYAGTVSAHFIYCRQVQRGTATGILNAIQKAVGTVMDWSVFVNKLVALGSDGAAVMLGKNNGVAALLQAIQPSILTVHCSGHRLELAYKDSIKHVPAANRIITVLTGLYYMYRNSALNRTNLKNAFKCLGLKVHLPPRASGTRWVGHTLKALNTFLSGYPALRLHLEQVILNRSMYGHDT